MTFSSVAAAVVQAVSALLLSFSIAFPSPSLALECIPRPEASDITAKCGITLPTAQHTLNDMLDRDRTTAWFGSWQKGYAIQLTVPDQASASGLYVCWRNRPNTWVLKKGGKILAEGKEGGFLHEFIPLSSSGSYELQMVAKPCQKIAISELHVFSGDPIPDWVQRWQPSNDPVDLMVLVAHPDDDLLFMGGATPYYAIERRKKVIVAYLSIQNGTRKGEALDGLWSMGIRHYPVFGPFLDRSESSVGNIYALWDINKSRHFVLSLVRQFKPKVILTHDQMGEYGHAAHIACAQLARYAFQKAGDAACDPQSAEKYGVWEVLKLYQHLAKENPIVMKWDTPSAAFGGMTPLEVAECAFMTCHRSQTRWHWFFKTPVYDCTKFGLTKTRVGLDQQKNDFFENIP